MSHDNSNRMLRILDRFVSNYGARFTKREKANFLDFCIGFFLQLGYNEDEIHIQRSRFGGRNLIIGKPDAQILFTAHYDTPGRNGRIALPFVETLGMVYSSLASIGIILSLMYFPKLIVSIFGIKSVLFTRLTDLWMFLMLVLTFCIKNKNNHNDNTSGCLGVVKAAMSISAIPELKDKCGFILFDNEEKGLFGSMSYAKWRRKKYPDKEDFCVFNMDCIGNGDILLLAAKEKSLAWDELPELASYLETCGFETAIRQSSILGYVGDHYCFNRGYMLSLCK